jgi:hypothetical protein
LAVSYSQQGIARKNARNRVAEMAQRGGGDGAEMGCGVFFIYIQIKVVPILFYYY